MYYSGKKVSERVEEMIIVNIDLKDKEFEKRLGRVLSGSFTVNLSGSGSEGNIMITDYDAGKPCSEGVIYLADSRAVCGDNIVYRFESAEHICKKVLYEYCRYYDDYTQMALGSPCSITGVCSARGGTGCSSIAIGIAQEMQRARKQQVLYISLDMIPFSPAGAECEMNINRLLFNFFTRGFRKEDLTACLSLDEYRVSYLNYVRPYNKLLQLQAGEFVKFVSATAESRLFTHIVLDIGSGVGGIYDSAISLCSNIVKVSDESSDICMKDSVYEAHIRGLAAGSVINAVNKFTVPDDDEAVDADAIYVDYCPDSIILKEQMIHISPEKEVNAKINGLLDKIMAK